MLGCSPWVAMERDYANGINFIMYFKDEKGLQDFAQSELHKEGWMWWAKNGTKYPHIHMWQETYVSPPGHWHNGHTNGAPTLLAACSVPVKTPEGTTVYYNPTVDASKGRPMRNRVKKNVNDDAGTEGSSYPVLKPGQSLVY